MDEKRTLLMNIVINGRCKEFLNKNFSKDQIQEMSDEDVDKYYALYNNNYASKINDTVCDDLINLTSDLLSKFLPIEDKEKLKKDLKNDYLVKDSIKSAIGSLVMQLQPFLGVVTGPFHVVNNLQTENIFLKKNEEMALTDTAQILLEGNDSPALNT